MASFLRNHRRMVKKVLFHIETALCYSVCLLTFAVLLYCWVDTAYSNYLLPNTGYSIINILLVILHVLMLIECMAGALLFGFLTKVEFENFNVYIGISKRRERHE